ncbi:hypothetical protein ABB37_09524 [Leptomonas pyrrhocoris]|uniref:tRNA:m(4)X modification enzyme TRM13 n=1 Tax=Leptomonas pyrrhocoris TaxID=157538 RepID=A0A0M9FQM4_LEPPY|nr:hypothetical protein ABB37_09524 [Leptomonas pyrrhocoris]XP_015652368.1 hypothetical protein ABB37_09524 [Leptomonas pyrrhocoris]KPA73928.1 hypothetical protein ABB37_09524 [Leptomonas pyrrhocoris]KPA73929.1 hypothetical protein ABB37_09524 [Leptomonas pyrrhocoris]|eukprot:XP_015652367.1 hypothetical protein ABB37_09524 [Leptomonas pyrrhocoris]
MSQQDGVEVPELPARKSARVEKAPRLNPDPMYCSYYVSRKHRFCRTECKAGSHYCCTHNGTHAADVGREPVDAKSGSGDPESSSQGAEGAKSSGDVRVACPINPNHTVYASRLERHVKVCPDLRFVPTQLPYFSEDKHANNGAAFVASAAANNTGKATARRTHRDLSHDDLTQLMVKVADCYRTCVEPEIVVMPSCDTPSTGAEEPKGESATAFTSSPPPSLSESGTTPLPHAESTSQKHGPQHTALLRCLSDVVLQSHDADSIVTQYLKLQPGRRANFHCMATTPIHVDGFLEFGAGKGGLSVALQQLIVQHLPPSNSETATQNEAATSTESATASEPSSAPPTLWPFLKEVAARPPLVVLDMDGFRRKGDARVRHSAVPLRRLRLNIKDVDLTQAFLTVIHSPTSSNMVGEDEAAAAAAAVVADETSGPSPHRRTEPSMENWAVLGKHLCGACTDFALSCLMEAPSLSHDAHVRLPIVVIATCCHHRCELRHLNPPVSLATATTTEAPAMLTLPGSDFTWSEDEFAALASMSSWAVCGGFVDEARRLVGRQCKRIIDQLRVHFLRRVGYAAFQCQYTTRGVTEENVCVVAFRK